MKYKVSYSGFCYVEADSPDEAEDKFILEDEVIYSEQEIYCVDEVDEFSVWLGADDE